MTRLPVATLLAFVALAGCGGGDDAESGGRSFNAEGDARYTEEQVADMAGLKLNDSGLSWSHGGCDIAVIMTTRATVELYASAGDAVVTNPAGDVGVKFSASDPGCREKLLAALEAVE